VEQDCGRFERRWHGDGNGGWLMLGGGSTDPAQAAGPALDG